MGSNNTIIDDDTPATSFDGSLASSPTMQHAAPLHPHPQPPEHKHELERQQELQTSCEEQRHHPHSHIQHIDTSIYSSEWEQQHPSMRSDAGPSSSFPQSRSVSLGPPAPAPPRPRLSLQLPSPMAQNIVLPSNWQTSPSNNDHDDDEDDGSDGVSPTTASPSTELGHHLQHHPAHQPRHPHLHDAHLHAQHFNSADSPLHSSPLPATWVDLTTASPLKPRRRTSVASEQQHGLHHHYQQHHHSPASIDAGTHTNPSGAESRRGSLATARLAPIVPDSALNSGLRALAAATASSSSTTLASPIELLSAITIASASSFDEESKPASPVRPSTATTCRGAASLSDATALPAQAPYGVAEYSVSDPLLQSPSSSAPTLAPPSTLSPSLGPAKSTVSTTTTTAPGRRPSMALAHSNSSSASCSGSLTGSASGSASESASASGSGSETVRSSPSQERTQETSEHEHDDDEDIEEHDSRPALSPRKQRQASLPGTSSASLGLHLHNLLPGSALSISVLGHRELAGLGHGQGQHAPLTPLEEVNSPLMALDSPVDLAEARLDPFDSYFANNRKNGAVGSGSGSRNSRANTITLRQSQSQSVDETFYHALLELVRTEESYTDDLTDLVEVHFNLLAISTFVTDEQRAIIVRDAAGLLDIHRRLSAKLARVDQDLGWIRDHDEFSSSGSSSESEHASFSEKKEGRNASESRQGGPAGNVDVQRQSGKERESAPPRRKKFSSSDATVADAARRICSIFLKEVDALRQAYRPFCSAHAEAMEIVKALSTASSGHRAHWEAFEGQCTAALAARHSPSTRLHFADFVIKPVQQICRYPLLFGNLLKHAPKNDSLSATTTERLRETLDVLKNVARDVDEAQKKRSLEIATVKIALRIDVQTPGIANLLNNLDQVVLVGSAHVIHTDSNDPSAAVPQSVVKAGFFGVMLFTSHLVLVRVRKTNLYEPKHWLPLRLFDLYKVPDGEGMLPYAIRLTYRNQTFEMGSLCHQEQNIWASAIESTAFECRRTWIEAIANNPVNPAPSLLDEAVVCSEPVDPTGSLLDTNSPIFSARDMGSLAASPDLGASSVSFAIAANALAPTASSGAGSDDGSVSGVRSRLSLKPPAQRVGVDLRMADILSDNILAARAQSKRSHAMPLHGPPPRSMTGPPVSLTTGKTVSRPHSFHHGTFSYRSLVEHTLPSRRTSIVEADNPRPKIKQLLSVNSTVSSGSSAATATAPSSPITMDSPVSLSKQNKLTRSKTSSQFSDTTIRKRHQSSRSMSTLSKIRRRATSLHPDQAPVQASEEPQATIIATQPEEAATTTAVATSECSCGGACIAASAGSGTMSAQQQASVARNCSTSSSSSCASSNSTGHSHLLTQRPQLDTPQSSLPASPLLTPVDLESQNRWIKLSDAITKSLTRKRSFASSRSGLAPEPLLEGLQLEQAKKAVEYIYSGSAGTVPPRGNSLSSGWTAGHDRRASWEPTSNVINKSASTQGAVRPTVERVQPSRGPGRSVPNLQFTGDKRQSSSGSLWSIFKSENGHANSPTPSIYESAHEDEYYTTTTASGPTTGANTPSVVESPPTMPGMLPSTSTQAYPTLPASQSYFSMEKGKAPETGSVSTSSSPAASASSGGSSDSRQKSPGALSPASADEVGRPGTLIKRKHSITARLRAFRALGSSMTPLPSSSQS